MTETYIEWTGNLKVYHPVKNRDENKEPDNDSSNTDDQ